jgi:ABC-type amino acid transport substrate-binding protein
LIEHLDIWVKVFTRINHYVVRLTPIGVFAISATASGTLSLEEFGRLQAYLFAYTGANVLLLVIVLPTLVTALTPFGYREVWAVSKESLVVALVTGKLLVVLPLLIESTEQLFQGRLPTNERSEAIPAVDVLYPLAYPFPHLGKLLGMLFIPFSAWFLGQALRWGDYPMFLAAGLFSYFGGPNLATPFLLDLMDLPRDMFQLFVLSGVYCGRLGDALGVMHLVTFALLTTCWFTGHFKVRVGKLVRLSVATVGVGAVILLGTRSVLQSSLQYVQPNDRVIAHMRLLESVPEVIVLRESQPNRVWRKPGQSLLDRVQERGVLRVGYDSDQLPFAYFNEQGELVGFDISLAHRLARDLGVSLELVPFDRATLLQQLEDDHFDVVMSALVGTLERTRSLRHTRPYLDLTLAFVVEDKQASQYSSMAALRKLGPVRIAYVELSSAFVAQLREELPDAIMVPLETSREFFERPHEELDALLTSAECGSAFCLLHPRFSVVIPSGEPVALPLVYAVADRDGEMVDFLNHWIDLRTRDGTVQRNYDYWISGKLPASKERRWCILRDELGWIN